MSHRSTNLVAGMIHSGFWITYVMLLLFWLWSCLSFIHFLLFEEWTLLSWGLGVRIFSLALFTAIPTLWLGLFYRRRQRWLS